MNFVCMGSLCVCFFMNFLWIFMTFLRILYIVLRISWRTRAEFICVYISYFGPFSKCISSGCFCFLGFYLVFIYFLFLFLFLFLFCYFCGGIFTCISLSRGELDDGQWREVFWNGLELNCFIFWIFDIWRVYNVYIIIVIIVFCGSLTGHRSLLIDSYIIWCLM